MEIISEDGNIIEQKLDKLRSKSLLEIYEYSDFNGLGYLINKDLKVYRYSWKLVFNTKSHNFAMKNLLERFNKKIDISFIDNIYTNTNFVDNVGDDNYWISIHTDKLLQEIHNEDYYKLLKNEIEERFEEKI